MGPLKNTRRELFAQAVARGLCNCAAQQAANYKPDRGNAARLTANDSVAARIAELQAQAAKSNEITIQSICAELDQAAAIAREKGQGQALVSVASLRAKLGGLMIERIETGAPGDFDNCHSMAEVVDRELALFIEQFRPVDEKDRRGLIEMYERHLKEAGEYIAAIQARPIIASRVDARHLDTPWQLHEAYAPKSPARIGYRGNASKPV